MGQIVETWPIDTSDEAHFVATHGSNYGHISSRVSALADAAHKLIYNGGKLQDGIIIDQDEWDLLTQQKQAILNKEKKGQIARMKRQTGLAIIKTKERCSIEIEGIKTVCDEQVVQCEIEKQVFIKSITGRGFFKRIALAFRIVFLRKT